MNRKTQRKNKTKQVVNWPSTGEYFTILSLIESNKHMLTASGSNITLRVRLNKAITEENLVTAIGQKNCGKGRPQLVFAMRPVNPLVVEKARLDGITIDSPKLMTIVEISVKDQFPVTVPVSTKHNTVNA